MNEKEVSLNPSFFSCLGQRGHILYLRQVGEPQAGLLSRAPANVSQFLPQPLAGPRMALTVTANTQPWEVEEIHLESTSWVIIDGN